MNYSKSSIKDLLKIYNKKASKPLKQWKSSKAKLIAKIEASVPAKKTSAKPGGETIQSYAETLLIKVAKTVKGVKYGFSYEEVLEKVQAKFKDASTSINSLRWYAAKLNKNKSVILPVRPRAKA